MSSIEERLQRLEDIAAITQLIASYGPAAEIGALNWLQKLWSEDAVYDLGHDQVVRGRKALIAGYDGKAHQELVQSGAAHVGTSPFVVVDGDRATATQYGELYRHCGGKFELWRLVASRWNLRRTADGGWEVKRRINRLIDGSNGAHQLLRGMFTADPEAM